MIYLDNNSTTQIAPSVLEAMRPFLSGPDANALSSSAPARSLRRTIEIAREQVAATLGAHKADEIVFTAGGTESINWAFQTAREMSRTKKRIVTTAVEHKAVKRNCEKLSALGYEIIILEVDENGLLDLMDLRRAVNSDTLLVSAMQANDETGVLFPVVEIARIVKEQSKALFHVDGVQAVGKIPLNLAATEIDLFSISGHKFHAPKGVGALYIRNNLKPALLSERERNRRAGAENLHAVVGLGAACQLTENLDFQSQIKLLRDRLENEILQKCPNARVRGTRKPELRLPNTTSISFLGIEGESLVAHLDAEQIRVSTSSACNADAHIASRVLSAMNISYHEAMGTIRFSLSRFTTAREIETVLDVLPRVIKKLFDISPLT